MARAASVLVAGAKSRLVRECRRHPFGEVSRPAPQPSSCNSHLQTSDKCLLRCPVEVSSCGGRRGGRVRGFPFHLTSRFFHSVAPVLSSCPINAI